ncbi:hypothetical protein [Skermania piniformis]|uniref:Integral membrane protein n=1 Tax=Skermania pinensis TaxID=39122 RepID=A0ABX8SA90_9ACTN|nr:hypothetical protein [Skermania piniformis]QXQ14698.1 hypothetical protein KV203_04660 [Skermania piniformis]
MPERVPATTQPTTARIAGALVTLQGAVGLTVAVVLVLRALFGADQSQASGFGTALWFGLLGGAVFGAGLALLGGRRGGRSVAVVAQILLLPVAWSMLTESHQPLFGVLLGVVVLATIGALFAPATTRWIAGADIEGV